VADEGPKHFDCPKCGRRYYEPQRFCIDCGLDFRAAFRTCPRCKQDTPRESEKCVNCGYDLEAHDMRRPRYIAGAILAGIIVLAVAIPYWWFHTPIGKRHGIIVAGELFKVDSNRIEFVPMFYEYQSGQRALRRAKEGTWGGLEGGMDATRLFPLPQPIIPDVNVSIGERVYVTRKARDSDGNLWYHVWRYRRDVVRKGWVHKSNIQFQ
jgi:hypothetical protein